MSKPQPDGELTKGPYRGMVKTFPCGCLSILRSGNRILQLQDSSRICLCGLVWRLAWVQVGKITKPEQEVVEALTKPDPLIDPIDPKDKGQIKYGKALPDMFCCPVCGKYRERCRVGDRCTRCFVCCEPHPLSGSHK